MSLPADCKKGALIIAVLLQSACAGVSVSDLSRPNFGSQALPHFDAAFDPDPMAITNGLYAPRPLQGPCSFCASRSQSTWMGWSP